MRITRWDVRSSRTGSRLHRRATQGIREISARTWRAFMNDHKWTPVAVQVTELRSLWDEPEIKAPLQIVPAPPRKNPKYGRVIAINGFAVDIDAWLEANKPATFNELTDLRRALYSFRSHGRYRVKNRGEAGPEGFVVIGPEGAVLIRSHRSRYYLLRQLSRMRRKNRWPSIRH